MVEKTEHVFLAGDGAIRFWQEAGLEMMAQDLFSTEHRRKALHDEMERRRSGAEDDGDPARKHAQLVLWRLINTAIWLQQHRPVA